MKNLNKVIGLLMLLLITAVSTTFGQPGPPPEMTKEKMMELIQKEQVLLQLDENQKKSHTEISMKYGKQMKALRGDREEREKKRAEAEKIIKAKNAEIRELLNDQQYEAYTLLQEERKNRMKRRRGREN